MENDNQGITRKDIEIYIQYTKMLWDDIRNKFSGNVNIEETDVMKMLQSGIFENINNNQVQTAVFNILVEPFSSWIMHDCVFTGHKAIFNVSPLHALGPDESKEVVNGKLGGEIR